MMMKLRRELEDCLKSHILYIDCIGQRIVCQYLIYPRSLFDYSTQDGKLHRADVESHPGKWNSR